MLYFNICLYVVIFFIAVIIFIIIVVIVFIIRPKFFYGASNVLLLYYQHIRRHGSRTQLLFLPFLYPFCFSISFHAFSLTAFPNHFTCQSYHHSSPFSPRFSSRYNGSLIPGFLFLYPFISFFLRPIFTSHPCFFPSCRHRSPHIRTTAEECFGFTP